MKLTINSPGVIVNEILRNWIEERIDSALERFSEHIQDVSVILTDQNGPRGGEDKHCRVLVSLWSGVLTTEGRGENVMSAVDLAARRARRVVKKKLQRPRAVLQRNRLNSPDDWSGDPGAVAMQE